MWIRPVSGSGNHQRKQQGEQGCWALPPVAVQRAIYGSSGVSTQFIKSFH